MIHTHALTTSLIVGATLTLAAAAHAQQQDPYWRQQQQQQERQWEQRNGAYNRGYYDAQRDRYNGQAARQNPSTQQWNPQSNSQFSERDRQRFQQTRDEASQRFQQRLQEARSDSQSLRGRIEDSNTFRHGTFSNQRVTLATDDGRRIAVYLGPVYEVADLNLQPGRTIEVTGYQTDMNGVQAFIARRATVEGDQRIFIERQPRIQRVAGQIADTWTQYVDRDGTTNRFAQLRSDRGQQLLVDLGPTEELRSVNLNRNQQVEARGVLTEWGGQELMIASQLRLRDTTMTQQDRSETEASEDMENGFEDIGRSIRRGFENIFNGDENR